MALVELHQQQRPCKTHDGYSGIKNWFVENSAINLVKMWEHTCAIKEGSRGRTGCWKKTENWNCCEMRWYWSHVGNRNLEFAWAVMFGVVGTKICALEFDKSHVVGTMISLSEIMSQHVESRSVSASHMFTWILSCILSKCTEWQLTSQFNWFWVYKPVTTRTYLDLFEDVQYIILSFLSSQIKLHQRCWVSSYLICLWKETASNMQDVHTSQHEFTQRSALVFLPWEKCGLTWRHCAIPPIVRWRLLFPSDIGATWQEGLLPNKKAPWTFPPTHVRGRRQVLIGWAPSLSMTPSWSWRTLHCDTHVCLWGPCAHSQTCIWSGTLAAWLSVKTITLFPAIRSLKIETPRASPSSSKMMVSWSDRLMAETNSGGAASLKKPRHLPSLSGSKPPMPEWPPGSKAASTYKCAQPKCLASTSRSSFASIRLFKVQKAAWSSGKSFWSPCWYARWAAHRGNSETASQTSGSRQTAPDPWAFLLPTCPRTGCLEVWLQRQAGPVTSPCCSQSGIPVRWLLWCHGHKKDAGKRKGWWTIHVKKIHARSW